MQRILNAKLHMSLHVHGYRVIYTIDMQFYTDIKLYTIGMQF